MIQKIMTCLCYNEKAEEAIEFYANVFGKDNVKVINVTKCGPGEPSGAPEGSVRTIIFEMFGQKYWAVNGGEHFQFTPATSLFVSCKDEEEIEKYWKLLSVGGKALMPLDNYGFSPKFGWIADKYGVNWQLNIDKRKQKVTTFFMFVADMAGKAEEAMKYWTSLFKNSGIEEIVTWSGEEGEVDGTVKQAVFTIEGQEFIAMDSSRGHKFTFTDAFSIYVGCETQEEIDYLWEELSKDGGEKVVCGWVTDKFGVAWQVSSRIADEWVNDPDPVKSQRVVDAVLKMEKIDINELKKAYEGKS